MQLARNFFLWWARKQISRWFRLFSYYCIYMITSPALDIKVTVLPHTKEQIHSIPLAQRIPATRYPSTPTPASFPRLLPSSLRLTSGLPQPHNLQTLKQRSGPLTDPWHSSVPSSANPPARPGLPGTPALAMHIPMECCPSITLGSISPFPTCTAACCAQDPVLPVRNTLLHWFLSPSVHTFSHCGDLYLLIARTTTGSKTGLLGVSAGVHWEWEGSKNVGITVGREGKERRGRTRETWTLDWFGLVLQFLYTWC